MTMHYSRESVDAYAFADDLALDAASTRPTPAPPGV